MLLLWLFGVGIGVANACLMSNRVDRAEQASAAAMDMAAAHDHGVASDGALHRMSGRSLADDGALKHPSSQGKSDCQEFCDKASVSIPPLKSALDLAQGHAALPAALAIALPVPVRLPDQVWVPRRDGVRAPPIPIAFLRLAL